MGTARTAGALLCALGLACGIKGPPRPPAAAAPSLNADGGAVKVSYRAASPSRDAGGFLLVWLARGPVAGAGRILVERHLPHGADGPSGSDGPACGRRRIVARLRATSRLHWRIEAGAAPARYRLLHEDGTPAGEVLDATALGPR